MVELLRLTFPYLLILFFVVKGIKEPFYLLGIPFLMFMSDSIFFEGVRLFQIPGRLSFGLMFLWLIFLWLLSKIIGSYKEGDKLNYNRDKNVLDYCIIGLLVISFIGLGMTLLSNLNITDVFKEFTVLISLFVCYFIIKNWASQIKPEVLESFLYSLVIINTFASLFYILHQGLQIHIYQSEEYSSEVFQGAEITRTFWFMPQFLPFSIAFILVFKERRSFIFYSLLIVNLLAVFISYTRSSLINMAIIFLFYTLLIGLKKGRLGLVLKNIFLYFIIGLFGLIVLSKIFPVNTKYFMSRFTELSESSVTSGPNSIEFRFIMSGIIISNMDEDKKIIGMGPVTENQVPLVKPMRQTTADMVWTGVIFRWGYIGFILFILLYISSVIRAYYLYMKYEGVISNLALMFLLYIISQVIESFVSWTFMSHHGFAIGLWYFAMLSVLVGFNKNTELSGEAIIEKSE